MSKYQTLIDALEAVTSTNWEHDGGADVFEVDVGVLVASTMETEDAAYIAEANPSTIRALLADLEVAEKALAALAQQAQVKPFAYMDDDVAAGVLEGSVLLSAAIRGAPGGTFNFPIYTRPQQAQEPVGDRYFSYSTDMGFEEFATQQEAIDCSNVQINGYREDAIRDDEWPDEVDSVCWGVILGRSKEIDTSNEDHESVDYKLYTTPPAPQVPAPVDELIEFEASMREKHGWVARDFQSDSFGYFDGHTATAWLAWQARAALQTKGQP